MAPRKTKVPTVSLRAPKPKTGQAAPLKPQAAVMDTQGSGFGGSYSGWQSTMFSNARRAIFGQAPGDLRQDLTPWNRMAMIRKCRWAERNSGLFKQILADMVLYTVGDGIKAQSHASTPEMQERYEAYFAERSKRIDITNRFSFYQAQAILLRGMIRDGDSFAAKVRNAQGEAKLQLMEAHRIGDPLDENVVIPGIHDGIIYGPYGEYTAVNVYKSDGANRQIPAQSMMHVVDHEYASGCRGVPLLQHSINSIQDEMEILALEKQAVKDNGDVVRTISKQGGVLDQDTANELGALNVPSYTSIANTMGGKLLVLDQGESLNSFQSNRPNATFNGFIAALERDISMGVLPWEFVSDPSKLGGASIRLVTAKASRVFGKYQNTIIETFCLPTWGYIIGEGIANGDLPDDPDWARVSWTTPKSVTVDAGRDAANDRNDVEMGLLSMSELYAQRGLDFRTEMDKRANDMNFIIEKAKAAKIPVWMLYKPGFNWLQQGQANSQIPDQTSENLDLPEVEDEPGSMEEPASKDQPNS
jgi:capsid protein